MKTILLLTGLVLASATAFGQKSYSRQLSVTDPCIGIGIGQLTGSPVINVFPNPTTGNIILESSLEGVANLYDLNGALLMSMPVSGKRDWDLLGLSAGVYILSFETSSSVSRIKLILEK